MTTSNSCWTAHWAQAASLAMLAALTPLAASADVSVPVKIYAQELVDRTVAQYPDLRAVVMHVTPPNASGNVIVA
jgi:iron complex outermembrane receptor protein